MKTNTFIVAKIILLGGLTGCINIVQGNQTNSATANVNADINAVANINANVATSGTSFVFPAPVGDSWREGPLAWNLKWTGSKDLKIYAKSKISNLNLTIKKPRTANWSVQWKPSSQTDGWQLVANDSFWPGQIDEVRNMPLNFPAAGEYDLRINIEDDASWETWLGGEEGKEMSYGNANGAAVVLYQLGTPSWPEAWPPQPKPTPASQAAPTATPAPISSKRWNLAGVGPKTLTLRVGRPLPATFIFERDVTINWRVYLANEEYGGDLLIGDESIYPGIIERVRKFSHTFPKTGIYRLKIWVPDDENWRIEAGFDIAQESEKWPDDGEAILN